MTAQKFVLRSNLSWWRFSRKVFVLLLVCVAIQFYNRHTAGAFAADIFLGIVGLSTLVFYALGWRRLRAAASVKPIPVGDFPEILRHFVGNPLYAVLWFFFTFLLAFGVLLALILLRAV